MGLSRQSTCPYSLRENRKQLLLDSGPRRHDG